MNMQYFYKQCLTMFVGVSSISVRNNLFYSCIFVAGTSMTVLDMRAAIVHLRPPLCPVSDNMLGKQHNSASLYTYIIVL